MKRLSYATPVAAAFVILGLCVLARLIDVFLVRSDELFGEQIIAKLFGLILIIAYVIAVKGSLSSIGLSSRNLRLSLAVGLGIMAAGLTIGYAVELTYLRLKGLSPELRFAAVAQSLVAEKARTGGLVLGITLLAGNMLNSFMEEGLFRGVLLTHFCSRLSSVRANLLQSLVFGLWHIVWPVRDYLEGHTSLSQTLFISGGYVLLSGIIGYSYGFLALKTGSLWTPWAAHTLNNTAFNFIHTVAGPVQDSTLAIRVSCAVFAVFGCLFLAKRLLSRYSLPPLRSWTDDEKEIERNARTR